LTVVINLSLITMIPAIHNCSLVFTSPEVYFVCKATSRVSRTRTPWRWRDAKDRKKLKGTKRTQPPMVSFEQPCIH
jgi:hypothetical protein